MNQNIKAGVSGKYIITETKTNKVVAESDNYITDWGMFRLTGQPIKTGAATSIQAPIGAVADNFRYLFLGTSNALATGATATARYNLMGKIPGGEFSQWRLDVPWWGGANPRPTDGLEATAAGNFYDGISGETVYERDPASGDLIVVFRKKFKFLITTPITLKEIGIGPSLAEYPANEWPVAAYGGNPVLTYSDPGQNNTNPERVRPTIDGSNVSVNIDGFDWGVSNSTARQSFGTRKVTNTPVSFGYTPDCALFHGIFSRTTFATAVDLLAGSGYTFTYEFRVTISCNEFVRDAIFQPNRSTLPPGALPDFPETVRTIRYRPFYELTPKGVAEEHYHGCEPWVPPFFENGSAVAGIQYSNINTPGGKWMIDVFTNLLTVPEYGALTSTLSSSPTHLPPADLTNSKFVNVEGLLRDTSGELIGKGHHYRFAQTTTGLPGTVYNPSTVSGYFANKLYNPIYAPDPVDPVNTWRTDLEYLGRSQDLFEGAADVDFIKLWKAPGGIANNPNQFSPDDVQIPSLANEKEAGFVTAFETPYTLTPPAGVSYWFKINYNISYTRV